MRALPLLCAIIPDSSCSEFQAAAWKAMAANRSAKLVTHSGSSWTPTQSAS